ncbi:hypothetical protein AVEN_232042-1 [Araneus ventricosus]|uniref:Endonuclease/exonuclease/phosphatase domain-containing protein n=1 Tax=Araneus ventricosus TaxID=182803 RepID=A0A4Y2EIH9_ARAVE|nr:hypothetical protein AVEN_232042-1 [Araneus ventricosus]
MVIFGDFNANSQRCGYRDEDSRGKQLQEFIAEKQMFLLNNSDFPPILKHNRQGCPDLTMVSSHSLAAIYEWGVLEEETYSDHNFAKICIKSNIPSLSFARFNMSHGGHCRFINHFRSKVKTLQNVISNSSEKKRLTKQPEPLNLEYTKFSNNFFKIKRSPLIPNITGLNRDLQIKKQEARRLKKRKIKNRLQNCPNKKEHCLKKQSKEYNVDLCLI